MTVDGAYGVQLRNVDRRLAGGATVVGHKGGLLSKVMQDRLGVDEPDYGHPLNTMDHSGRGTVDVGNLCSPRVEVELAYVLLAP
ncbi:hypothetical protein [Pseudonocardia oroxyli]|nr:hypothetical protein [Pseudonocardia oroxyli]